LAAHDLRVRWSSPHRCQVFRCCWFVTLTQSWQSIFGKRPYPRGRSQMLGAKDEVRWCAEIFNYSKFDNFDFQLAFTPALHILKLCWPWRYFSSVGYTELLCGTTADVELRCRRYGRDDAKDRNILCGRSGSCLQQCQIEADLSEDNVKTS
jgi:hypothetical protein